MTRKRALVAFCFLCIFSGSAQAEDKDFFLVGKWKEYCFASMERVTLKQETATDDRSNAECRSYAMGIIDTHWMTIQRQKLACASAPVNREKTIADAIALTLTINDEGLRRVPTSDVFGNVMARNCGSNR